jgi:hypothetical protein
MINPLLGMIIAGHGRRAAGKAGADKDSVSLDPGGVLRV